jgi:hypothetical protein
MHATHTTTRSADPHGSAVAASPDPHGFIAGASADRSAGWARRAARPAYAALAAVLLGAALFVLLSQDTGWWQFFAFGAASDIALLAGIGSGLEKGRLHPRAVPLYNALHRFAGPLALGVVVVAASLPAGYLVGAVAWSLHIAVDRVAGYGLRTPDGFQRN